MKINCIILLLFAFIIEVLVLDNGYPFKVNETGCIYTIQLKITNEAGIIEIVSPSIHNSLTASNATQFIYQVDFYVDYGQTLSPILTVFTGDQVYMNVSVPTTQLCTALSSFIIQTPPNNKALPVEYGYYQDTFRFFIEITNLPVNNINTEFPIKKSAPSPWSYSTAKRLYKNIFYFDVGLSGGSGTNIAGLSINPPQILTANKNYEFDPVKSLDFGSQASLTKVGAYPENRIIDMPIHNFQIYFNGTSTTPREKCVLYNQEYTKVLPVLGNPLNYTMVTLFTNTSSLLSNPVNLNFLGITNSILGTGLSFTFESPTNYPYSFNIQSLSNIDRSFITISCSFVLNPFHSYFLNSKLIQYPYGYHSGDKSNLEFKTIVPVSQWLGNFSFTADFRQQQLYNVPLTLVSGFVDSVPPKLESLQLLQYPFNRVMIKATISDDLSGFKKLSFGQAFELTAKDLVSGNLLNGVYQSIVDYNIGASPYPIYLYDNANTSIVFSDEKSIYNIDTLSRIPTVPYSRKVLAKDFTRFEFKSSLVNLSSGKQSNVLYFNMTNADSNSLVKFTPIYSFNAKEIIYPWLNNTFTGGWNTTAKLYQVEIEIPARLFNGRIGYTLQFEGATISNNEIEFYHQTATLTVETDFADIMPPLVTKILATSSNFSIGFLITISDPINGFKKGSVHLVANLDPQEYIIDLTEKDRISGDIFSGTYNISVPFDSQFCRSQSYTIRKIILMDQQNVISSNFGFKNLFDPLSSVHGGLPNYLSCATRVTDTTPPTVSSFLITFNSPGGGLDVGTIQGRTIKFSLTLEDLESGVSRDHIPKIYAVSQEDRVSVDFEITAYSEHKVDYQAVMILPYGFAFPNPIYFSVYGIVDLNFNIGSHGLDNSLLYEIKTTLNSAKEPWIETSLPITSKGGDLVVYGRNFGDSVNNVSRVFIDYQDGYGYLDVPDFIIVNQLHMVFKGIRQQYQPYKVKVLVDSLESNEYLVLPVYEYFEPIPLLCPGQPECSGNGRCINGECICTLPNAGLDCSSTIIIIPPPKVNTTSPETIPVINTEIDGKNVSLSGLISVVSIRELTNQGTIVQEYPFSQWLLLDRNHTNENTFLFSTRFDQSKTNINVTVSYFSQATNVTFANQLLHMSPGSIKYQIEISKYQFSSQLNYLQLIMSAKIQTEQQDSSCTYRSFNNETSQYTLVQIDKIVLQGRFIKRAIVDRVIKDIVNVPLDEAMSSGSNGENSKISQSFIGINIPFYRNNVSLDPDFSVLIDQTSASDKYDSKCSTSSLSKSKLTNGQLAGIIVGGVVFLFILSAIIIYFISKKGSSKRAIKLRKLFGRN
ncbi:hypothetical protein CYY_000905 [Polysphondylium violaceum]|uniref:EGF-like domain-containing protein n=1 Tax=Polysphondylium violaceum TaxID=133409 RepID=A0A8J4Q422_9MYCE|nr:hypothetical protein CYY_000905 [Polysphondylium violaceum]